ncbi:MAG: hypothetical protein DMG32_15925 [Acidobacteria bacterium]|nr:MAG: hypothetical protein DMG32_15925 [Acidobacteriota bacterium]
MKLGLRSRRYLGSVCLGAAIASAAVSGAVAQSQNPEQTNAVVEKKIWSLLDDKKAVYVTLPEADFRSLGEGFDLPDGGKTVTELAKAAPGGAFNPSDLEKIPPKTLGYKAAWIVERYKHYNMDWDITGLKLTSLNPDANRYPWFIIINGGAANWYEFYVDLKNNPGWAQYLAQKINVMIVTIPGNFKYGGWEEPIESIKRQPRYLLDTELPDKEIYLRNVLLNNQVVLQGVRQIIMKNTVGDILISGHSTSGELALLAFSDPELGPRFKGRYFGWGSGGPARLSLTRPFNQPHSMPTGGTGEGEGGGGKRRPLDLLSRRDVASYSRGYSFFLNPLYVPGMSINQIAAAWLSEEARRRPQFKQQIQDLEHGAAISEKGYVEVETKRLLKESGNPWNINFEDVDKELFSTQYTRMGGYKKMVWTVGHFDRNHWLPEDPMNALEVYVATQYREVNPDGEIRLIVWDPPLTHYGHLELPKQKAAADYSVIRWLVK